MSKSMGYLLIAIGIAAIIGGIVVLSRSNEPDTEVIDEPEHIEAFPAVAEPVAVNQEAETTKSDAKEKGDSFENFVINLLADHRFSLLDRTQDAASSAGVVAESSKNPDLHVQQKRGKSDIDYYIECKYRSRWFNDAVTFKDWQIERYRQFQRENHRKVIIALGVGGTADAPETVRLVPIDSIKDNTIRKIDTKFAIDATPSALFEYMDAYFTTVFNKARYRK